MKPQLGNNATSNHEAAELLCPSCGDFHLHHDKVEIFERDEDAATGLHVSVSDQNASFDLSLVGNPSARRNGLKIHFWCEGCDDRSVLSISQVKGVSEIQFEVVT